ncbi:HNH endonuclease [Aurantiacibacter poecillastricola]|uniref:HNH endonuclease n=1 Tax=Aurantiacibacter poecillastricola TaxID=3064385 RepID=UPI00273E0239|nr:HNH endonuclease [Aurantiacibacter sp. 219JJ12-13]MDP5262596.1 HNH endonuclease [Aurantiacibacter sp. 219JJ12-13]
MTETNCETCWLCERPLGRRVQWHHTVPKAKKGRLTVPVHPICHRTIHAHATNAQLARMNGARGPLLALEEVEKFLRWIADKPPDFHAPTRRRKD